MSEDKAQEKRRVDLRRKIKFQFKHSPILSKLPPHERQLRMRKVFEEMWPMYQVN